MKFSCRECGVLHTGFQSKCGACGFSDKDAPGSENWCKRED